ncbi:MAG: transaldolase [Puniceicoccales bacterium]|nr:transaldolase [Puniceicoccales bacterium]
MQSVLEQLKSATKIVADSGDFELIGKFKPQDATTNPSLILKAAKLPQYAHLVDACSNIAAARGISDAVDELLVLFGVEILKIVPGRVSTEVDARLSFDASGTVERAKHLLKLYESHGIDRGRVLIKIAATWEGIQAARILEKDGIGCNLTLLFSMVQAAACAAAGATLISPFVGRILDWYTNKTHMSYAGPDDPGVKSVVEIFNYCKHFDYGTEVMGASFRNTDEIIALAGCDLLTISPPLLEKLGAMSQKIKVVLSPDIGKNMPMERIPCDEKFFRNGLSANAMATEKLSEGIGNFVADIEEIERLLLR